MAKRRSGLPEGFTLDLEKPTKSKVEKPIRVGDYLDDIDARSPASSATPSTPTLPSTPPSPIPTAPITSPERRTPKRARLNVSMDARKRLAAIVDRMAKYGPEPDVRASDVIEALVLALYDTREHLDLSNVRRRGKFGSATHKAFPIALAESITHAMAAADGGDG